MKNLFKLFALLSITTLIACGGDSKKEEENIDLEKNPLGALMKMSENMEKQAEKMEQNMENRKDAKAMHYEELIKYLPTSIDGYKKEEPEGESIDMGGMSYSTASVEFKKGNDEIEITILDYNAALSLYSMATAMWASGFKIDSSEEMAQSVSISESIHGWESIQKKSKEASLVLGVNDRFLITIEAENQEDLSFLKDIAKTMDLKELAGL
jgi:hypothetical protein